MEEERVREKMVEEWEGLRGDGCEQEKRRGEEKRRMDKTRGEKRGLPNFVQVCQTVPEIWPFTIFQNCIRPPSWIFK